MADNENKRHIKVEGYTTNENYKYPKPPGGQFRVKPRDRTIHGNRILRELEAIREQFQIAEDVELQENIIREDAIYVEFISDWEYELKYESLTDSKGKYQLVLIKQEKHPENNTYRYRVVVMLTKGGISEFIKKVKLYLTKNTKKNNPKSNNLVANIENIQLATLKAFWVDEPEIPFPNVDQIVWWEVWFRKSNEEFHEENVLRNLSSVGAQVGSSKLNFTEHIVRLVKASATQLSQSLMLLDSLAELRKPQEMADFVTHQDVSDSDKTDMLNDLIGRTENLITEDSVLICLLDSGVNNLHPLINKQLPNNRLYTWKEDWGKADSCDQGGHGTGMAGLALYGDLIDALSSNHKIQLYHSLESFKIFNPNSPNDPELYGVITEYACSTPIADNPKNPRIFCLAITNTDFIFKGRPSSSSASIDKIAFGSAVNNEPQLLLVSGGNVVIDKVADYPNKNYYESVHDPGQAYNALTIGSYTRKNRLPTENGTPLALNGAMAPSNSTSTTWETQWPNKPDIVMEGGNLASDGINTSSHDSLRLLSIDKEFPKYIFLPFSDTSAAVALASKMAAELRTQYPDYWPETIRALIVHSADWTDAMLSGRNLNNENDRRAILRSVGYGVPIIQKALYSAKNSLTLIAQRTIQPFRQEKSDIKYHQYHLFKLPWPVDILRDVIFDKNVKLKVTLSYFIEPNPGNRQYANNFRYHSHELDFNLIKRDETLNVFKRRISAAAEGNDEDSKNLKSEAWTLKDRIRSKGSIKKDFIVISGAELSTRNVLAVYPKNGWYRTLKKHRKFDSIVRYSLIVSIETEETEIDLYTPVQILVDTPITI